MRKIAAFLAYSASYMGLVGALGAGATLINAHSVHAQALTSGIDTSSDEPLLLSADSLIYDFDNETVTAVGGVQIQYQNNGLVAQSVTYNQKTGRLLAKGNVELVDPSGTRIYADSLDITDNFADGFVAALRVETSDNTRFAAASASRSNGNITTFEKGIYTACEACADKPEKPLTWQVKAETIIWNEEKKTIRFQGARFEMFGYSLAALPSFEIADHTVKRKSGFLFPEFKSKTTLGASVKTPYFWALAPNMDLTLRPGYYALQGAYLDGTFRHRLHNGSYSVTFAGVNQLKPQEFDASSVDSRQEFRGMVGTKGNFSVNPRWTFGWDILEQTDKNFSQTYEVPNYSDIYHTSEIYLTGLDDRNYFDLRAQRFEVQELIDDSFAASTNDKNPYVLPNFNYAHTLDQPVLGGELSLRMNGQNIYRENDDIDAITGVATNNLRGLAGNNGRFTTEIDWKKSYIAAGGLSVTPYLGVRGDARYAQFDAATNTALATEAGLRNTTLEMRDAYYDYMATAGLELRYPVLFIADRSTHIVEPIAQIFARPDSQLNNRLGIANEDAQSMVFDASSLFERDKFSGYDRIEGGTRANIGIRYSGTFVNGFKADALFGQSYHLAGANSFASQDLVNAGAYSGLETSQSDFVGMAGLSYAPLNTSVVNDWSLIGSARLDEKTFELRRGEVETAISGDQYALSAKYTYIQKQPLYGFDVDRHEVSGAASLKFADNWTASADATYNLESKYITKHAIGLAYDDECFNYGVSYTESRSSIGAKPTRTIGFNISLRTLGGVENSRSLN